MAEMAQLLSPRKIVLNAREESYQRFVNHEQKAVWVKIVEFYIRHVFFGMFYIATIWTYFETISWARALLFTIFMLNVDCVFFGMNHVNTHAYMLMYDINTIEPNGPVPYPFWHHYRNPMLFELLPHQYRMGITGLMAHFYIDLIGYCTGLHPIVSYCLMLAWFADYWTHEYYHTKKYRSLNPFSPQFVGVGLFFGFFECIGFIDCHEHDLHHKVDINHMDEADLWIDFGMPVWKTIIDPVCDLLFYGLKKVINFFKARGYSKKFNENVVVFAEFAEGFVLFPIVGYLQKRWFPELDEVEVTDLRVPSTFITFIFVLNSFFLPWLWGSDRPADKNQTKLTLPTQNPKIFFED